MQGNFFNLYTHQFARVAVGVPRCRVADPEFNAAQTLHPVAGQGLNLGLRDAMDLAKLLRATPRERLGVFSGQGVSEHAVVLAEHRGDVGIGQLETAGMRVAGMRLSVGESVDEGLVVSV